MSTHHYPLTTIATVFVMAAVSFPAKATLITYMLSSDASATFAEPTFGANVIDLSGKFTIDTTATNHLSSVDITATCTGAHCPDPLHASPVEFKTPGMAANNTSFSIEAIIPISPGGFGEDVFIGFSNTLFGSPPLPLITIMEVNINSVDTVSEPTGSVSPTAAATPEPSSLALLVGVLGLLFTRRSVVVHFFFRTKLD